MTDTTTTTTIDPDETPQGTADGRTAPEPGQGTNPDPGAATGADDRTPGEGDGQPDSEPDADDHSPGAEAARYRRRLRDTEAERDALAEQLEASRRAFVDHLLATTVNIAKPAGFWASGVELADLLDDDGAVDPAKVNDAAVQAQQRLGLQPRADRQPDRSLGRDITPAKVSPSWSDALR